ncbi:hypothetical protein DFH06DRAFT_1342582 [Mycena polygramma]|nr:hypothetical protein DFH06DRAFT_1342582 [Mycena polygramma]
MKSRAVCGSILFGVIRPRNELKRHDPFLFAATVTVFLRALLYYDFFEPSPAPTTLAILTGVLRMSHKYKVDALRKRALVHISAFHPTTLDDYQALSGKSTPWFEELASSGFMSMLALARDLSLDWILPITFYRVCELAEEEGIFDSDINTQDQVRFIVGCRMLEGTHVGKMLDFLWPRNVLGCNTCDDCATSKVFCRRDAEDWRHRDPDAPITLPVEIWEPSDWSRLKVCDVCLSSMKGMHQRALQSFWDELPSIFSLPPWSELEKLKAEALE